MQHITGISRNQTTNAIKKTHNYTALGKEINEHIFGTIKRQWGYNHTNLTGLEKVNGEHSLIMLVYNIKRTINILGVRDLISKIKNWKSPYKTKVLLFLKWTYLKLFRASIINQLQDYNLKISIT